MREENGAIERRATEAGEARQAAINSSGLPGLTLATCAEVDPDCNDAHGYFTAEGECSLQEDFGELALDVPHGQQQPNFGA